MIVENKTFKKKLKALTIADAKKDNAPDGILFKDGMLISYSYLVTITICADALEVTTETFIIPSKAIEFISNLPDDCDIDLTGDDKQVTIKSTFGKSKFSTVAAELYPETYMIDTQGRKMFSTNGKKFYDKIMQISNCASINPNQTLLNGVHITSEENLVEFVTTDGYRCAINTLKCDTKGKIDLIIPMKTIEKIKSSITEESEVVIYSQSNKAMILSGSYIFHTKLYEGNFIEFSKILPTYVNNITVDRKLLLEALKRSSICYKTSKTPYPELIIEGEKLFIYVDSSSSTSTEVVPILNPMEIETRFSLIIPFLLDACTNFYKETIEIHYVKAEKPILLKDGTGLETAIMPRAIRVNPPSLF